MPFRREACAPCCDKLPLAAESLDKSRMSGEKAAARIHPLPATLPPRLKSRRVGAV